MKDRPDVQYAHNGDVAIAYQVFGEGSINLLCVPGFVSNLFWNWELPGFRALLNRLGEFARVIIVDRRGIGLSDRFSPEHLPSLEVVMDDLLVVLDDVKVERAAMFGWQSGATIAALTAATYPDRITELVTFALDPCPLVRPGWPHSWTRDVWDTYLADLRAGWGTRSWVQAHTVEFAPDSDSRAFDNWALTMFQLAANPATAEAVERVDMETDIRAVLPSIHVPTLVLHRPADASMPAGISDFVASHVPNATAVALPGRDNPPYMGDTEIIADEVEVFLTGVRHAPSQDRILATVMFTDVVESTQRLAELGDARWADLLVQHNNLALQEIERHRGRHVSSSGDGLLATFDGPARAVRCARAIGAAVHNLGLEIRAGCHTGEIQLVADDIAGLAVHIGARVGALAAPSEVLVTSTVKDLTAGSGLVFEDAGQHELKGIPDQWHLYRVRP